MKHWRTKEEMGEGFQFNEKDHMENEYNSLEKFEEHEKNLMRTFYLIRDVWTYKQLIQLRNVLDDIIEDKENSDEQPLCTTHTFYKWNDKDTFDSVLELAQDGIDTIHTEVAFYKDKVVLTKTDCEIFDVKKHIKELSYKDFVLMMNRGKEIETKFYDWEFDK
tara:strand:- start:212 stop:700 length:489 start_codon:yes stop_codon:yes gene_type:complete